MMMFSFVTLLEYAEEVLFCNHIIIYFKKNRADQSELPLTYTVIPDFNNFCTAVTEMKL